MDYGITFLCFKGCSTCAKARRWLDEHHVDYVERNIKEENPTAAELREWKDVSGTPIRRMFNTSGQLYRKEHVKDRLDEGMDEEEAFELLASNGMMVRRPILVSDDFALFGFDEKAWEQAVL